MSTSQHSFSAYFEAFGPVEECVLKIEKDTGRSRGFGFVIFKSVAAAEAVLKQSLHELDGKRVECKLAIPKTPTKAKKRRGRERRPKKEKVSRKAQEAKRQLDVKRRKVFVGGLPHSVTDEELKDHFSKYGDLEDYVVMVDRATGKPRGFGFVTFTEEAPVDKVMDDYDT